MFLVSRPTGRWDLRSRVCPSIRTCVRLSHFFSETVHFFFSETLQLVRACKREKNFPRAFLIIFTVLAILVKKFFPLILPKKHSLITQKQFWPCFGVFSGFLGVPQNYIYWSFKSVFWQFLSEKNGRKSRDSPRRLVSFGISQFI